MSRERDPVTGMFYTVEEPEERKGWPVNTNVGVVLMLSRVGGGRPLLIAADGRRFEIVGDRVTLIED